MSIKAHKPKSDYFARAAADMAEHLSVPPWALKQKLALSCRFLAREEHGSGIAGQITARGEANGTMWTLPFGVGFEEMKASDFLLVDDNLNVLEGKGRRLLRSSRNSLSTITRSRSCTSRFRFFALARARANR